MPVAQGRGGRQRAPVRPRQRGEGEAERRRRAAERREARIELDAGAEQQDVPLERRQAEDDAEPVQRRGRRDLRQRRLVRRGAVRRGAGMTFERVAHAGQRRDQVALVRLRPGLHGEQRLTHTKVTVGPNVRLAGSRSSGLSAPSTWRRTKYWPGVTPLVVTWIVPASTAGIGAAKLNADGKASATFWLRSRLTRCPARTGGSTSTRTSAPTSVGFVTRGRRTKGATFDSKPRCGS